MSGSTPLRWEEREIISRELRRGSSARMIGAVLGRHHSAVSREIARNGGRDHYRAAEAQRRCDEQKARPKERKLEVSQRLYEAVREGLEQGWSPQQISKRLREEHPEDESMRVSHETIYEFLYLQERGELRNSAGAGVAAGADPAGQPVGHGCDQGKEPRRDQHQ
ncbi:MAG: hypothetical protein QG671_2804 [Actinomycetota bacterium]|nr:hypothetical protein [Actinomycetota bacterium]